MEVHIAKLSDWRVPRKFIDSWLASLQRELKKRAKHDISKMEMTIAFVDSKKIKKLNQDFRSKGKVTDILSFSGFTEEELGELVVCGEVIDKQSIEHGLSRNEELGYLLIHGVLHLLGYEHEKGGKKAKEMFELQDSIFEVMRKKYFRN